MKTKIYVLIIFVFFAAGNFPQGKGTPLENQIDKVLDDPFFSNSLIAIDVYDLTADKKLFSKNSRLLLHPASNMKLMTSAAALIYLGPDYKFTTKVMHTGQIQDSILYGDIYFVGGLDPDFTTDDLKSLISVFEKKGIKEITGNIYGDVSKTDSLFWGKGWMWDDDPSSDAPYLTPLSINDNSVEIYVYGEIPGEKGVVQLKPETDFFEIENKSITVPLIGKDELEATRDWINRRNRILVRGEVRRTGRLNSISAVEKVNVVYPELFFLTLAKEKLEDKNIKIDGNVFLSKTPESAKLLNSHSHSLDSVIINMNKESDNLSAELTLRALGAEYFNHPVSADSGIAMIDSMIIQMGLDPDKYRMVDGSGLSHYNLVSSELLIETLKYIYSSHPDLYEKYYNSLPVAGVDGTLERRMYYGAAFNNVHAKTGTLSGVVALSGYLTNRANHQIAFSMLIQNFVKKNRKARNIQDRICEILAESE